MTIHKQNIDEAENTETFAKLRELLNSAEHESRKAHQSWMYEFRALLLENYRTRPDIHQQLWIPYCTQHLEEFETLQWTVTSIERLLEWHEAAPFVEFRLEFNSRSSGDWILQKIAASPATQMLVEIQAMDNEIMDEGLIALANSPYTSHLRILQLGTNHIGSEGVEALICSPTIRSLEMLDFSENELWDKQLTAIANSNNMKHLRILDLSHNKISDKGLEALANSNKLESLERITLRGNRDISRQGYEVLILSEAMPEKVRRGLLKEISNEHVFELANQLGMVVKPEHPREEMIEWIWQNMADMYA